MSSIIKTVFLRQLMLSLLVSSVCLPVVCAQHLPARAVEEFRQAVRHFEGGNYSAALNLLSKLERSYADSFDIQHLLAIILDLTGNPQEANRHFQKAVELNPGSGQARTNYATSLIRIGRMQEAIREFQKALKTDPGNATASFNLGTIFLQEKKFRKALPWLEKAYQLQPRMYQNGYHFALCLFALGEYPRVQEVLDSLKPVPPEHAEFFLILALNQSALGRADEAKVSLKEILPLLVEHPEAHEQAAMLLFGQGLYREAIPMLEEAVRRFPDSESARRNLARAELETGNLTGARKHAGDAFHLKETAEVHGLLGDILEAGKDPVAALQHYQEAVKLDPSESNLFALGYQFLSHWNWKEAEQIFESALERIPGSWRLSLGLGTACMGQNEYEKATQVLLRATESDPNALLGYHLLAQSFDQSSDSFGKAVARFEEFHRRNPDDPWALYYQVLAAFRSASKAHASLDEERSLGSLQKALARRPDFFQAQFLLGEIQFEQKRWDAAVSAFEKAVELDPNHVEAHYKLALAFRRSGRTEEAKVEMARYQALKKTQEQELTERVAQTTRFIVELKKP